MEVGKIESVPRCKRVKAHRNNGVQAHIQVQITRGGGRPREHVLSESRDGLKDSGISCDKWLT